LRFLHQVGAAISDVFTGVPADPAGAGPQPTPASPSDATPAAQESYQARLGTQLLHRPGRLRAACLATVLGPAIVAQAGWTTSRPAVDTQAVADSLDGPIPMPIPGDRASWLPLARRAAATCPGLSSSVLVAISYMETSLGLQTRMSSAGAVGPMQFLPSTWAAYGVDGDGDGLSDVMKPIDAMHGAARLLCANGAGDPEQLPSALWNYNHSDEYVRQVLSLARVPANN